MVMIGASLRAPKPASRQNKGNALITANSGRGDGAAGRGRSRATQQDRRAPTHRMPPTHVRRDRQTPAMTASVTTSASQPTSDIAGKDGPVSVMKIRTVPKLPTPTQMA